MQAFSCGGSSGEATQFGGASRNCSMFLQEAHLSADGSHPPSRCLQGAWDTGCSETANVFPLFYAVMELKPTYCAKSRVVKPLYLKDLPSKPAHCVCAPSIKILNMNSRIFPGPLHLPVSISVPFPIKCSLLPTGELFLRFSSMLNTSCGRLPSMAFP